MDGGIPHGDMPGDKVEIGPGHVANANTIFPLLLGIDTGGQHTVEPAGAEDPDPLGVVIHGDAAGVVVPGEGVFCLFSHGQKPLHLGV